MSKKRVTNLLRASKGSLVREVVDRLLSLLEGPVAASLVKLAATGLIGLTMIGLTGAIAFGEVPVGYLGAVLGFGTLTTVLVWLSGGKKFEKNRQTPELEAELEDLRKQLKELGERVGNVEVIENFESRLARKQTEGVSHAEAETTVSARRPQRN